MQVGPGWEGVQVNPGVGCVCRWGDADGHPAEPWTPMQCRGMLGATQLGCACVEGLITACSALVSSCPPPPHTLGAGLPQCVQRGDAEMSQKLWRVVRACVELGEANPIEQIHDQGAGGNCNVVRGGGVGCRGVGWVGWVSTQRRTEASLGLWSFG